MFMQNRGADRLFGLGGGGASGMQSYQSVFGGIGGKVQFSGSMVLSWPQVTLIVIVNFELEEGMNSPPYKDQVSNSYRNACFGSTSLITLYTCYRVPFSSIVPLFRPPKTFYK